MCFSAEASFTASAVIGAVGLLTCKSARNTRFMYLAVIPLMFAFQQFAEGIIWLNLVGRAIPEVFVEFSKYLYLAFAFVVWPVWLPLSLFLVEELPLRKWLIFPFLLLGTGLAGYFLSYLPNNTVIAEVNHQNIHYTLKTPFAIDEWFLIGIYTVATIIPCLISSTKFVMQFGILSLLAWVAAEYFFNTNFTSVWCFFCALVSVFIYIVIRANVHGNVSKHSPN